MLATGIVPPQLFVQLISKAHMGTQDMAQIVTNHAICKPKTEEIDEPPEAGACPSAGVMIKPHR